MPFTDPMADGPAIQASGLRALKSGQNMKRTLSLVREFRARRRRHAGRADGILQSDLHLWRRKFLADAGSAGVDGLIVVDLPPEEDTELCLPALKAGFNFIRLATPTTDDRRLPKVLQNTSGFVYYVSITGITGSAAPDAGKVTGGGADQAAYRSAGLCRLRRPHRRAGPVRLRLAPTVSWSARLWSRRYAQSLGADPGKATGKAEAAVSGLVRALAEGVRQAGVKAAAAD